MSKTQPIPDTEAIYDAQIAPLMGQIITIAKAAGMPFVTSFQLTDDDLDPAGALCCTSASCPPGTLAKLVEATDVLGPKHPASLLMILKTPR